MFLALSKSPFIKCLLLSVLSVLTLTHCSQELENNTSQVEIAGGRIVNRANPVAQHSVFFTDTNGNVGCSGVLVGRNQVLSAAHCWGESLWPNVHVAFTTALSDVRFSGPNSNARRVLSAVRHDGYKEEFSNSRIPPFDIALVTFEGSLPRGYEPATVFSHTLVVPNNIEVILAGFGVTQDGEDDSPRLLRYAVSKLGKQDLRKKEFYFGATPGYGACGGDSGGPAFYRNSQGEIYLLGTASRGTPDSDSCLDGKSIYTDARFYQDWLEHVGDFKMKTQTHFVP